MYVETEEQYYDTLNEITNIYGFIVSFANNDIYISINNKKYKMDKENDYYFIFIDGKKICLKSLYIPRMLSTGVLIEVYITDGKDREYVRLEQELSPQTGMDSLSRFTINSYVYGKSNLLFSNGCILEVMESNCLNSLMYSKIEEYEGIDNLEFPKEMKKREATRFLFGINSVPVTPIVELDKITGLKKKTLYLKNVDYTRIYYEFINYFKTCNNALLEIIPFLEMNKSKTIVQKVEGLVKLSEEEWNNLFLSIVKKETSTTCFNNVLNYYKNHRAFPYIMNHFSEVIKCLQRIQEDDYTEIKELDLNKSKYLIYKSYT